MPRLGRARQPRLPNLSDHDWLYGGEPETIQQTITKGRNGVMPPFSAVIDAKLAGDVAQYVRSLSGGLRSDPCRTWRGHVQVHLRGLSWRQRQGNRALGAPNLSDNTWLYGSSESTIVEGS